MGHAGAECPSPVPLRPRSRGRRACPRRLVQLYAGLALYGAVDGAAGALGARRHAVGRAAPGARRPSAGRSARSSIVVGALVLLAWIPLRQRPGRRHGEQRPGHRPGGRRDARRAPAPSTRCRSGSDCWSAGIAAQRRRHRRLHRRAPRPRPAGRPDDRPGAPHRPVGAAGPHRHRGRRGRRPAGCSAAPWGVGTVLYALAIGPLVQVLLPRLSSQPCVAPHSASRRSVSSGPISSTFVMTAHRWPNGS